MTRERLLVTRPQTPPCGAVTRLRVTVRGIVQGVGFRPFVYRLATDLGLCGWVRNSTQGVILEVEGTTEAVGRFWHRFQTDRPRHSAIHDLERCVLPPADYATFEVRASSTGGNRAALVLPDLATCANCLREVLDPANRRYRYPFTSCTGCGPRFSILEALPYDRARTTMKAFALCERCRAEYADPGDRRFHHQPNACPRCGPHLELWGPCGEVLARREEALAKAADALRRRAILAVKGLGGFHLLADARDEETILRLRHRKSRDEKPFALMFPDLGTIQCHCLVSEAEAELLRSPPAPIVLLRRRPRGEAQIPDAVAPKNPYLGVMLPYTPLHHLLLAGLGFPVVATSGNRSEEPICTDEREALERLGDLADLFLIHNRPIARHLDDSVVRVVLGRPLLLRAGRGYAPVAVHTPTSLPPLLATGAHLKNTVAVTVGEHAIVSQHIGDLDTAPARVAFGRVQSDLLGLYAVEPAAVACDAHPDYASTRAAEDLRRPVVRVQHHEAHVYACLADNGLTGPALGVAWDGTGYGPDSTVWGGEFLHVTEASCRRVAHLRRFRLPGGDTAAREPRRAALGLLYELFGNGIFEREDLPTVQAFTGPERRILRSMLERGLNAPWTSSAGRLFDAIASLCGLRQVTRFEGQAAMDLEFAVDGVTAEDVYPFRLGEDGVLDWGPPVREILADVERGQSVREVSARLHNTLAEMIVAVARRVGETCVALTGGCFQNGSLLERIVRQLEAAGFRPCWHRQVPPNDGGIALGQIVAAARHFGKESGSCASPFRARS